MYWEDMAKACKLAATRLTDSQTLRLVRSISSKDFSVKESYRSTTGVNVLS